MIDFSERNANIYNIKLIWIPAHIGIRGNEYANQLAKAATAMSYCKHTRIPFTDLRQNFKLTAKESAETYITEQGATKGTEYFVYYYAKNSKPWFANSNLTRANIVTINRCKANHYNLAASLTRINIIDDPNCSCNTGPQDLDHILWQCPLYDAERKIFVSKLKRLHIYLPNRVRCLLLDTRLTVFKILHQYFQNCKLDI